MGEGVLSLAAPSIAGALSKGRGRVGKAHGSIINPLSADSGYFFSTPRGPPSAFASAPRFGAGLPPVTYERARP